MLCKRGIGELLELERRTFFVCYDARAPPHRKSPLTKRVLSTRLRHAPRYLSSLLQLDHVLHRQRYSPGGEVQLTSRYRWQRALLESPVNG